MKHSLGKNLVVFLITVFLFSFPTIGVDAGKSGKIIFVDIRLLVGGHPMMKKFDPATRTFLGTSSDPTIVTREGFDGLQKKLDELETRLTQLTSKWAPEFSKALPDQKKDLEKRFLLEKRELEEQVNVLRKQKLTIKVFPGSRPFAEGNAIIPQVEKIFSDIKMVISGLREKYQADLVLDISSLLPAMKPVVNEDILFNRAPQDFRRKGFTPETGKTLFPWLVEARNFWLKIDGDLSPIPIGAQDCRSASLDLLKEIVEKPQ